ncbi:hypothetical protein BCR34DRAFT_594141 [Clohesyomyces aquaticus]|uniref:Uncharacterized protein n=1 Tax=Clohesyomyces aquaticus TaxID=1231657 RepID=A0A1Y1YC14_9PLEO|nr:hypothetical protein BCR34DRAFT_594141 [Clohesyomyces aquaticus]
MFDVAEVMTFSPTDKYPTVSSDRFESSRNFWRKRHTRCRTWFFVPGAIPMEMEQQQQQQQQQQQPQSQEQEVEKEQDVAGGWIYGRHHARLAPSCRVESRRFFFTSAAHRLPSTAPAWSAEQERTKHTIGNVLFLGEHIQELARQRTSESAVLLHDIRPDCAEGRRVSTEGTLSATGANPSRERDMLVEATRSHKDSSSATTCAAHSWPRTREQECDGIMQKGPGPTPGPKCAVSLGLWLAVHPGTIGSWTSKGFCRSARRTLDKL